MSQPKGKVPSHIKPKEFQHPQADNRIIKTLIQIEDPRKPSCNFQHSLVTIIFVSLLGAWFKFDQKWVSQSNQEPAHI